MKRFFLSLICLFCPLTIIQVSAGLYASAQPLDSTGLESDRTREARSASPGVPSAFALRTGLGDNQTVMSLDHPAGETPHQLFVAPSSSPSLHVAQAEQGARLNAYWQSLSAGNYSVLRELKLGESRPWRYQSRPEMEVEQVPKLKSLSSGQPMPGQRVAREDVSPATIYASGKALEPSTRYPFSARYADLIRSLGSSADRAATRPMHSKSQILKEKYLSKSSAQSGMKRENDFEGLDVSKLEERLRGDREQLTKHKQFLTSGMGSGMEVQIAGGRSKFGQPQSLYPNPEARPSNYRERVFAADNVARDSLKLVGDFVLGLFEEMDYQFDFGYSTDPYAGSIWTWEVGSSNTVELACVDSGTLKVTVTRTAAKKISATFSALNCSEYGWTQNGVLNVSWDDAKVDVIENPRSKWPLTASTGSFVEVDPSGNRTEYSGSLQCDWVTNSLVGSVLYSFDPLGNFIGYEWIQGSALDDSEEAWGYLQERDDGLTKSNLIWTPNCDSNNLMIRKGAKTHRVKGQKFLKDRTGEVTLISKPRVVRLEQIEFPSNWAAPQNSLVGGIDLADEEAFLFLDAISWDYEYAESLYRSFEDGSYVIAVTFHDLNYRYQFFDESERSQEGNAYIGIDFDGDGSQDIWPYAYNSWIEVSNGCIWEVFWQGSEGLYVDYQPNAEGKCRAYDYFFANSDGEITVEDADADGISDALDDDSDNDGLSDEEEFSLGSNPYLADSDGDGVDDGDDVFPIDPRETADSDGDGVGDYMDDFPNDSSLQYLSNDEILADIEDSQLKSCLLAWSAVHGGSIRDLPVIWCGASFYESEYWNFFREVGLAFDLDPELAIENYQGLNYLKSVQQVRFGDSISNEAVNQLVALKGIFYLALDSVPSGVNLSTLRTMEKVTGLELSGEGLTNSTINLLFSSGKLRENVTGLRLANGSFDDVSILSDMEQLGRLWLGSEDLRELSPLANLGSLLELALVTPLDIDLSPVTSLPLKTLYVEGAKISDFGGLAEMSTLSTLELRFNGLKNLDFLKNSSGEVSFGLYELYLRGNEITDVSDIPALTNLTRLSLTENPISDISPLSDVFGLEWLSLRQTNVSDLSPLQNLNLRELHAYKAKIENLEPLANLYSLEKLVLFGNSIRDIGPLGNLYVLNFVDLYDNEIREIGEAFSGMSSGVIFLDNNPVLCPSLDRFLEQKSASVDLYFDPLNCLPDSDDDGLEDALDAFPENASEQLDSDGDGTGNNADLDDDDDGFGDEEELRLGTDPTNPYSCPDCFTLDVDQNGVYSALTDGLLIVRYLFEFRGDALIEGIVELSELGMTIDELESFLEGSLESLDVDGDGNSSALTDGLLILRYLFEFTQEALFDGAVSEDATRTPDEMYSYLQAIAPPSEIESGGGSSGGGSGGEGGGSSGGTGGSSESPPWKRGEYGDWRVDYVGQCESPRQSNEYDDVPGSTALENFWLRAYSFDTYLWYQDLVDINPHSEASTLDAELSARGVSQSRYSDWLTTRKYFELLKSDQLSPSGFPKDKFHFTYDTELWKQLSQSGISAGYGMEFYVVRSSPPRQWLIAYTEPNTPASDAGVVRGLEIASIDGVDFKAGSDIATLNAGLFPKSLGEVHTFVFRDTETQETFSADLESQKITSTPVQAVQVFEVGTQKVGYMLFNDHIATAESMLINAAKLFKQQGVSELILDLRYNGGGYLDIARTLASMIAGAAAVGKTFEQLQFNDKYPSTNPINGNSLDPYPFTDRVSGLEQYFNGTGYSAGQRLPLLDLNRVVVIGDAGTCSASEAIINGLKGVGVEVVLIGDSTCGKPYGFYGLDNCGTTYFTIQFRGVNAIGFGDYSDGFSPAGSPLGGVELPGCAVADDLTRQLGDPEEGRLAAALNYLDSGNCSTSLGASQKPATELFEQGLKGSILKKMPEGMLLVPGRN